MLVFSTCFPDSHCNVCIFSQTPTEVKSLVIYSLNYSDGWQLVAVSKCAYTDNPRTKFWNISFLVLTRINRKGYSHWKTTYFLRAIHFYLAHFFLEDHGYSLILKMIDKVLLVFTHLSWSYIYFMLSSTTGSSTTSFHKLFWCLFKLFPGEPCCNFFQALLRPLFSLFLML